MKSRNVLFSRCLSRDHIGHDVVDLDISKLLSAKQKLIKNQSICEAQLTSCKDAYLKSVAEKFDEMMKQVSDTTKREISSIDQEVSAITERLKVANKMSNIGEDSPKSLSRRRNNLMKIDTSKRISTTKLTGERSYKYFDYPETDNLDEDVERLCRRMVTKEMHVTLSGTNGVTDPSVQEDDDFLEEQVCSPGDDVPDSCFQS